MRVTWKPWFCALHRSPGFHLNGIKGTQELGAAQAKIGLGRVGKHLKPAEPCRNGAGVSQVVTWQVPDQFDEPPDQVTLSYSLPGSI